MVRPIITTTLAVLLATALAAPGQAQEQQAQEQQAQGCPANLVPMYEGVELTDAMLKADDKFKSTIATQGLTPEQGAHAAVVVGWRHFFERQNPTKAMQRFNQAWQLDPESGAVYHGMAVMSMVLGENPAYAACPFTAESAEALFQRALGDGGAPPIAYSDYGRFLLSQDRPADAIPPLQSALDMDPDFAPAKLNMAVALSATGETERACALAKDAHQDMPNLPQDVVGDICAGTAVQ